VLTADIKLLTAFINMLTAHIKLLTAFINVLTAHIKLLTAFIKLLTADINVLTADVIIASAETRKKRAGKTRKSEQSVCGGCKMRLLCHVPRNDSRVMSVIASEEQRSVAIY
jgi:hypothetical protein